MSHIDNSGLLYLLATVVAACFGSFITLIVHRMPRNEAIVATRSRCPSCHTFLSARDLVPIASYVLARGTCRYCKVKILPRYPLIELGIVAVTLVLLYALGPTPPFLVLTALSYCLIALTIIDLEHFILPNEILVVMAALAIIYALVLPIPLLPLIETAAGAGGLGLALRQGFWWWKKKHGLGMGDVKFFAVTGLWLGPHGFVAFLFFSGVFGLVFGLLWRALGRGERFPFGPALAAALLVCLTIPFASQWFWRWMY